MSDQYINRMRAILLEMDAVSHALEYILKYWDNPQVIQAIKGRRKSFEAAARQLEETYIIRLTAEFEGILKDYLQTNHAKISIPPDPKIDWLLSKVLKAESFKLDVTLRNKLNGVRDYRNSIAHSGPRPLKIAFQEVLSSYNKFLAKLPDPYR